MRDDALVLPPLSRATRLTLWVAIQVLSGVAAVAAPFSFRSRRGAGILVRWYVDATKRLTDTIHDRGLQVVVADVRHLESEAFYRLLRYSTVGSRGPRPVLDVITIGRRVAVFELEMWAHHQVLLFRFKRALLALALEGGGAGHPALDYRVPAPDPSITAGSTTRRRRRARRTDALAHQLGSFLQRRDREPAIGDLMEDLTDYRAMGWGEWRLRWHVIMQLRGGWGRILTLGLLTYLAARLREVVQHILDRWFD